MTTNKNISADNIATAYSFFHQKQRVYEHSTMEWQRDDIEYAVAQYVDDMNKDLYNMLACGREDFLMSHSQFAADMKLALNQLEILLEK